MDVPDAAPPLLVALLGGNVVTGAATFALLGSADASRLRRLHPAVAGAVAGVPWSDMGTPVLDVVRWRAALPCAVSARPLGPVTREQLGRAGTPAWAALAGVRHLDLHGCAGVVDELLRWLPTSLSVLNVRYSFNLTARASFTHLTGLTSLDCSGTKVLHGGTDGLPPSLQELDMGNVGSYLKDGASLAHLRQLRVLRVSGSAVDATTLASLPPSLLELQAARCRGLPPVASFAHLSALRTLDVSGCTIVDASLATLPPSLVSLNARLCCNLTRAAVLPPLPALRVLDVSDTDIGDAMLASLPPGVTELRLVRCRTVTRAATLDHVPGLRVLVSVGTELDVPPACAVPPAVGHLHGHRDGVTCIALLAGGRLASGDADGEVRLWRHDVPVTGDGEKATAMFNVSKPVVTLAALLDGRRLAVGTAAKSEADGDVEVWDVDAVPPVRGVAIPCGSRVTALMAAPGGRLAAGCEDGGVKFIDVGAGVVASVLAGHTGRVAALAHLPDGTLASGSSDESVRLWDAGTTGGAGTCVGILPGHAGGVSCMAVLADGRLACGTRYSVVQLWDVGARTCVGVMAGRFGGVAALAALPDGRLVSGSPDFTILVWDTRPAAAAGASRAAAAVPFVPVGRVQSGTSSLAALPDGRLASGADGRGDGAVHLWEIPPPAACE
mgnify:CR=1 FL=1